MSNSVSAAARDDPQRLRTLISTTEFETLWLEAFKKRLRNAERDAVRIYAELRRELGEQVQVAQLVFNVIGADLATAKQAVEALRQASVDRNVLTAQCERHLLEVYRDDPRANARSPLRGLLMRQVNGSVWEPPPPRLESSQTPPPHGEARLNSGDG